VPLDFVQNKVPKLRRGRPRAGGVAGGPRARMGAAGARRPLHRARHVGAPRRPAGARLPLRVRVQRRQPRRRSWTRGSSAGSRARRCRSSWRSPSAPRPTARAATWPGGAAAGSCCARSPRPGRGRGRLPGHRAPPLLQHEHAVGGPARARRSPGAPRGRPRAADDRQPQDGGPGGRLVARGHPAGDRDGRGDRRVSRARGRCGSRGGGSRRSRRRTTCSCCAPTPTC
jgi:hypothetical protein